MPRTATVTAGLSINGDPLSQAVTLSNEGVIDLEIPVAYSVTDLQISLALVLAKLQAILILADQDLTLETNAADATGGQAFALKAGIPFLWIRNSGIANPITTNITTAYVTNAGGSAAFNATLKIRALVDATPGT